MVMRLAFEDEAEMVGSAAALVAALKRLRGPDRAEAAVLTRGSGEELRAVTWGPWWRVERRDGGATLRALRSSDPEAALPDRQWLTAAATRRAPGEFETGEVEAVFTAFFEGADWPNGIAWEAA